VWLQDGGTKKDDVDSPQSRFLNDEKEEGNKGSRLIRFHIRYPPSKAT
jgi:hypothetical protein